jgi:hypothetical protein
LKIKVDLHVHTIYSGDSKVTLEAAVEAAKRAELDGIAITDHDTVEALNKIEKFKKSGILIIPGIEISAIEGHILAFGVWEPVPPGLSAEETIKEVRRLGGVAVAAHPLFPFKKGIGEKTLRNLKIDAIETLNASTLPLMYNSEIKKLNKISAELGLPQVGGSDSHLPETVGLAYTVMEVKSESIQDILEAIKTGNVKPEGSRISMHHLLNKLWLNALRKLGF